MIKSIMMNEFEVIHKTKNPVLIDVREDYEYDQFGHIPGAINYPMSNIAARLSELPKDTQYYLVCQTGSRSMEVAKFMSAKGYNVVNVMGGTGSWRGNLE